MFAIAANGFNKPSETFIRSHARLLAPGNTLLIAERREFVRPLPAPLVIMSKRLPMDVGRNGGVMAALASLCRPSRFGKPASAYLARLLRKYRVTTLMVEYGNAAVHFLDVVERTDCRFYVHFLGVDASRMLRDPTMVAAYQDLFEKADGIIAPSAFLAKNLHKAGCPKAKLHVVPCGVNTDTITPGTLEAGKLVAVGRFTEKKAPLHTIDAFASVAAKHPNATLDMVGDGPLFDQAKARIAKLGLTDKITLHGMLSADRMQKVLRRASIFIQHSVTAENGDTEGLPVAILEAMSAGLPVVSTQHSGIPEAVTHGETGFLVPEHDVTAMGEQMSYLLSNPDVCAAFGKAGRAKIVAGFSEQHTIRKLQTIMGLDVT